MGVIQIGWNPHTGRTESWLLEEGQMHPPPRPIGEWFDDRRLASLLVTGHLKRSQLAPHEFDPELHTRPCRCDACRPIFDLSMRWIFEAFALAMEWLADFNAWVWAGVGNRIGAGAGLVRDVHRQYRQLDKALRDVEVCSDYEYHAYHNQGE